MRTSRWLVAWWLVGCADVPLGGAPAWDPASTRLTADPDLDHVLFEAGPVRPVALTPSGDRLVVANLPDDRIEVFQVDGQGGLTHEGSVAVGMRPVAVAARTDDEVWVVNHLSDSVSVVDLDRGVVTRTLLVGDEPRDIVFAGPGRAFVTTARRGQHRNHASVRTAPGAGAPRLTTAGLGRADVWVFDADAPGNQLGGRPLAIVTLFGDTPRGLAVSPDGATVYAAIHHSGNRTTVVSAERVCNGFDAAGPCAGDGRRSPNGLPRGRLPGGALGPDENHQGLRAPETGIIVRFDPSDGRWEDRLGRNWSNGVRYFLPDQDLFAIDAGSLTVRGAAVGVGTTLFNVATNPVSGRIYVSNLDALNDVIFEGPGTTGGSTVQGDVGRTRITLVDPVSAAVTPVDLDRHLDRSLRPAPPGAEDHSLSTPLEMVVSEDGETLYLAAFGSGVVGVIPTRDLEDGSYDPTVSSADHVPVTGGGPGGLALDDARGVLFAYTRFDNGVSVIDTTLGQEVQHVLLHSPEPAHVVAGRPFLYDARATSSNGEASCASCHVFGDTDHLAWNLGNPDADVTRRAGVVHLEAHLSSPVINGTGDARDMHPLKGPMLTQTLRGLAHHGPLHWRGDRMVGLLGSDPLDERTSFVNFVAAFGELLGDDLDFDDPVRLDQIEALADFVLEIVPPPNPVRALDNSLTPAQRRGFALFTSDRRIVGEPASQDLPGNPAGFTCVGCHVLDPATGRFGTDGAGFFANPQVIKVPHFRNAYTRVGMFGIPNLPSTLPGGNLHRGNQIRGYGFLHDGSVDTLFRLHRSRIFTPPFPGMGLETNRERRDLEQYLLAFDSDLAPVVGQQVTVHAAAGAAARTRAQLLAVRAGTPFTSLALGGTVTECDLVVHLPLGGRQVGMVLDPDLGTFLPDSVSLTPLTLAQIFGRVDDLGVPATFTCMPPGSGIRTAIDRDRDGVLNGDDLDPADPEVF